MAEQLAAFDITITMPSTGDHPHTTFPASGTFTDYEIKPPPKSVIKVYLRYGADDISFPGLAKIEIDPNSGAKSWSYSFSMVVASADEVDMFAELWFENECGVQTFVVGRHVTLCEIVA